MRRILLCAFACRPGAGSEWGVGWNYFIGLSKFCEVHLVTEGMFKSEILEAIDVFGIDRSRIHFIDVSPRARERCINQGDWRFYIDYRIWQIKAYRLARDLCRSLEFDLAHHLNMIGFREPGSLHNLDIPFVLGPVGGFGHVPDRYFSGSFSFARVANLVKIFLNFASLFLPHVRSAFKEADVVFSAYPEAEKAVKKWFGRDSILLPETGCSSFQFKMTERKNLVWVGKNVARKQFRIAVESFLKSDLSKSELLIVIGRFSADEKERWINHSNVKFAGVLTQRQVVMELSRARALLFTSVHEGNPHAVFEALTVATPVICHDCFGMGNLIDDSVGFKIERSSPNRSISDFSQAIDLVCSKNFRRIDFERKVNSNQWDERVQRVLLGYEKCYEKK